MSDTEHAQRNHVKETRNALSVQDIYYLSSNSTAWYLADWSKCHFSAKRNINSARKCNSHALQSSEANDTAVNHLRSQL